MPTSSEGPAQSAARRVDWVDLHQPPVLPRRICSATGGDQSDSMESLGDSPGFFSRSVTMDQSDAQSNLITSNLCSLDCIGMSSDSTESFGSDLCLFLERKCIGKATSSAHMCSSLARKDLDRFGMIWKNVTCYNVDFKRNINEKLLGGNPTHRIARPRGPGCFVWAPNHMCFCIQQAAPHLRPWRSKVIGLPLHPENWGRHPLSSFSQPRALLNGVDLVHLSRSCAKLLWDFRPGAPPWWRVHGAVQSSSLAQIIRSSRAIALWTQTPLPKFKKSLYENRITPQIP